jgi:hypothetical protein
MQGERRREDRYVVVGMDATLDGVPCTIVDISRSGVRLLRPAGMMSKPDRAVIVFTTGQGRRPTQIFEVEGRLVRASDLELIYAYQPPHLRWASLLRSLDTFRQTALSRL